MGPTWELLDKIGIILGILAITIETIVAFWVWQMTGDVEDIQDDVDEINDELDDDRV